MSKRRRSARRRPVRSRSFTAPAKRPRSTLVNRPRPRPSRRQAILATVANLFRRREDPDLTRLKRAKLKHHRGSARALLHDEWKLARRERIEPIRARALPRSRLNTPSRRAVIHASEVDRSPVRRKVLERRRRFQGRFDRLRAFVCRERAERREALFKEGIAGKGITRSRGRLMPDGTRGYNYDPVSLIRC